MNNQPYLDYASVTASVLLLMMEEYIHQRSFTESPYVKLAGAKLPICLVCAISRRELRGALESFQYKRSLYGSLEIVPDSSNSIHSACLRVHSFYQTSLGAVFFTDEGSIAGPHRLQIVPF